MSGMRLTFQDLGFEVEIAGAERPGMPPWRIAVTRPAGRLGSLTRRRFPTIEALVAAVLEHCATQAPHDARPAAHRDRAGCLQRSAASRHRRLTPLTGELP